MEMEVPSHIVRDLVPHRFCCKSLAVKNYISVITQKNKETADYFSFLPSQESLKAFDHRLIACNGDCGSKISQIIDYCAHNKVM